MKRLIVICFWAFVGNNGFAQPSPFDQKFVDSITTRLSTYPDDTAKVNNLAKLASMYIRINPALTVKYAKEGAVIAERINYPIGKINCLGQTAFFYAISGEWVKATIDINEAIPLCEKYSPTNLIGLYQLMFINASTKGDNDAIKYALKALHHPDFPSLSPIQKWATYMQLGRAYVYLNQLDSANYYANLLTGYVEKYSAMVPDLADNSNIVFGQLAFKAKKYTEAIKFFGLASDYISLTNVYDALHQRDYVIHYALKGLEKGNTASTPHAIIEGSKILAQTYSLSNPKEANKYLMIYSDAKDALYNNNKLKQLEEINFNIQKTEYERQKAETANRNKLTLLSLLGIVAFFSIVSILLWRNNRFKQKANLKLEATLTELKATQTQLIQSEKLASLGELTAGIAHEIQNPLNFVNNFSELSVDLIKDLKDEIEKPTQDKEYIGELFDDLSQNQEKINHHGKRASSIVKGMLEHSRASTGVKELTDINKLADEYLRLSYHGLRAKDKDFNAAMETHFQDPLSKIEIIPQDMGRVLVNLFNNAFYASLQKAKLDINSQYEPKITVTTEQLDNQILIKVMDNGTGMPESVRAKVFQPFFTTKPTGQGTGLGLSLAYDIVTKGHGGSLEVDSTEGVGTTFFIKLPI
jgi:two-component system, NtrC family, sensor kinase